MNKENKETMKEDQFNSPDSVLSTYPKTDIKCQYPSTLANSTLILLFSEMFENVENDIICSKSKDIVKENNEYLGTFHLLK